MAVFNSFNDFVLQLGKGVHQLHAAGHTLEVYLSNAAPSASLDSVKADLAEITVANGYTGPEDIVNDYALATATGQLTGTNVTITAAGGSVGPFQYVILQNTTPTSPLDPLIGWWDRGSALTLADGESFAIEFAATVLTIV